MSTLLLDRPSAVEQDFEQDVDRQLDGACRWGQTDAHGGLTLDDLITSVWEGLAVRATVACPVCSGPMAAGPLEGDDGAPAGGCSTCGSQLS